MCFTFHKLSIALSACLCFFAPKESQAGRISDLIHQEAPQDKRDLKAWTTTQHEKLRPLIEERDKELGLYLAQIRNVLFEDEGEMKAQGMKIYSFLKEKRARLGFKEQYFLDIAGRIQDLEERFKGVSIGKYRSYQCDKNEEMMQAYALMKYVSYSCMHQFFALHKAKELEIMDEDTEAFLIPLLNQWSLEEHQKRSQQIETFKSKIPPALESEISSKFSCITSSQEASKCREGLEKARARDGAYWQTYDNFISKIRAELIGYSSYSYSYSRGPIAAKATSLLQDISAYQPLPLKDLHHLFPKEKRVDVFLERKAAKWKARIIPEKSPLIQALYSRQNPLVSE